MSSEEKKLSIITPTFNRSYIINILYNSLKEQTCLDFEWVVIDDGSTDNTENVIKEWINNQPSFKIKYLKQKNGGKHRAVNSGVRMASYDYIYIIDSDDYLVTNGVEKIYSWITDIGENSKLAGIAGLRGDKNGNVIGQYPSGKKYVESSNIDRRKNLLLGDKAEVYKKAILEKYPFPEFENEKFLSEIAVWNKIAEEGYEVRWYGEIICICSYLNDGLTKNNGKENFVKNFEGYTYVQKNLIRQTCQLEKILNVGKYIEIALLKGLNSKHIKKRLEISSSIYYLGYLFNLIIKFKEKQKKYYKT